MGTPKMHVFVYCQRQVLLSQRLISLFVVFVFGYFNANCQESEIARQKQQIDKIDSIKRVLSVTNKMILAILMTVLRPGGWLSKVQQTAHILNKSLVLARSLELCRTS